MNKRTAEKRRTFILMPLHALNGKAGQQRGRKGEERGEDREERRRERKRGKRERKRSKAEAKSEQSDQAACCNCKQPQVKPTNMCKA